MRYLSIRRIPKTLFGADQPDLLLMDQDNGENWLGFTGRRCPRKLSLEQISTADFFGAYVLKQHRAFRGVLLAQAGAGTSDRMTSDCVGDGGCAVPIVDLPCGR